MIHLWRSVEVSELRSGDLVMVKIFGDSPRVDLYHILSAELREGGVTMGLRYFVTQGGEGKIFMDSTEEEKWLDFTRRGILFRDGVEITRDLEEVHE